MTSAIALGIFFAGYLAITIEHKIKISKSAIALATGSFLWLLVAIESVHDFEHHILEAGSEIFSIVVFLLAAMSLVEILVHYKFFDVVRGKIFAMGLSERGELVVISSLAFFLSGIIDNLTTTIVMIQIARKFFTDKNLLIAAASIVIAANAGGAFSPIGDVTTIMLWLADKFTAWEVISWGFLPALTLFSVSLTWFYFKITESTPDASNEIITALSASEKVVVTAVFASFILPLVMGLIGLPPYIGLLIGLGIVWILIDILKQTHKEQETHLSASIEDLIKNTDVPSLKFFIGILLAVSALHSIGILEQITHFVYGADPSTLKIIIGNVGLGLISAVMDNVPLTAIAIQSLTITNTHLWVLLAITVGTGGSLFIIGSAAGVVAMGMIKELDFGTYFKIAFFPALISFFAAVGVFLLQFYWLAA